ncbi:DUF6732 family protein [Celeribacter litoreus]|uniref:DUF6732 family protein n=1 Tax=Celeribacter litoreus TaxID=2876714 RepID=UPI001CCE1E50|nr:DUF6732 family protein [Celeribacter litoreus]MCA0043211.1 hypothetical protein [Celeribacter litoreus]
MKKLIALSMLMATPALAHEGHAELAGSHGHQAAHFAMAAIAAAVVWLVVETVKGRAARTKGE